MPRQQGSPSHRRRISGASHMQASGSAAFLVWMLRWTGRVRWWGRWPPVESWEVRLPAADKCLPLCMQLLLLMHGGLVPRCVRPYMEAWTD